MKAKSTGILCGLRAFLLHSGADKRPLEAFYHCGAPPKSAVFLLYKPPARLGAKVLAMPSPAAAESLPCVRGGVTALP